jgi:hypothetical protein
MSKMVYPSEDDDDGSNFQMNVSGDDVKPLMVTSEQFISGSGLLSPTANSLGLEQKTAEITKLKDRIEKIEKLLSENLETMDYQAKQYEGEIENLTDSNLGM